MSDVAAPAPSKAKVFFRRLITTVILWTVILPALFSSHRLISNGVFILLVTLLAVAGLAEFYGLAEKRGLICFQMVWVVGRGFADGGHIFECDWTNRHVRFAARVNDFETGFLILFVLGLCVRQFVSKSNMAGIVAIATTLFGLMYVPWLLNFIQKINFFPER